VRRQTKPQDAAATVQRRFCCSHRAVALALQAAVAQALVLQGGRRLRMADRLHGLGVPPAQQRRTARLLRRLWAAGCLQPRACVGAPLAPSAPCVELLDGLTIALDCTESDEDRRAVIMARGELDEELLRVRSSGCRR
jgi:hypothetical protein